MPEPVADTDFDPGPLPSATLDVRLTDDQVAQFHAEGYASTARITTDEELAWLRPVYDFLFAEKRGAWRGSYFDLARPYDADGDDLLPQVLTPEVRFAQLRRTNVARNARAIASQLIGRPDRELKTWSHMILKPPQVGGALPWHQDEAYWSTEFAYRALACWVPLDPATVESGCMHFLPGSQAGPVRPHRHIGDDPSIHGLETDVADPERAVAVPIEAGGATFHHCRMLHMTTPNRSDRVRRAWSTEVQVEPVALAPGERPERPWIAAGEVAWARRDLG
jgi:ectoine hydroxylase-related dioxygenase (phytanoyl-CoA dioxygenase family)